MFFTSVVAAAAFAPIAFCTTNGPMNVNLSETRFQASYVIDHTGDHGVIVAARSGHVVDGQWNEPALKASGPFKLFFSKDMTTFTAAWEMKEGTGNWYGWLGRRRDAINPESESDKQYRC